MTTTMLAGPMDREAKRRRREEVKALADEVRHHIASETWSEPGADLSVIDLEFHVRGKESYIEPILVQEWGHDSLAVLDAIRNGTFDEEGNERLVRIFALYGRDLVGAELIELGPLAVAARNRLDAVITGGCTTTDDEGVRRVVKEITDAEHAGEFKRAKQLTQTLLDEVGELAGPITAVLERARRDQQRLVELGVIEPPHRNWRQRVTEALRGTGGQAAY